ncbi:MAG: hypothetical protein HC934_12510 [Acaryochloridaceae cyanobacterium SU_2_1]|nr:hypothetical protein [Acaryochloridaceae cyanobacterium SU_2_1]
MAQPSKSLQQFLIEDPPLGQVTLANLLELAGECTFGFLLVALALASALHLARLYSPYSTIPTLVPSLGTLLWACSLNP